MASVTGFFEHGYLLCRRLFATTKLVPKMPKILRYLRYFLSSFLSTQAVARQEVVPTSILDVLVRINGLSSYPPLERAISVEERSKSLREHQRRMDGVFIQVQYKTRSKIRSNSFYK